MALEQEPRTDNIVRGGESVEPCHGRTEWFLLFISSVWLN